MSDTDEIRAVLNSRLEALRRRDAKSANAVLDGRMIAFEVAGALQLPSAQATDDALTQAWLDSFEEGPRVTMEELAIYADGCVAFCHSLNRLEGRRTDGVAFCHSLNRLEGRRTDGQEVAVTMRSTLGFRKVEDEWKVVHGHTSLPR